MMMTAQGIDVSKHQGTIDWVTVKNTGRVDFAILRAGYGNGNKDAMFERNYLECKKNGIPVGAYWYLYSTTAKGALEEAKAFEQVLYGKQIDLPIFLDIEEKKTFDSGNASEIVDTFCSYLESKGFYIGVYCSKYWLNTYLPRVTARWAGWVAQWSDKCTFSQPYLIWQKSEKGKIAGITGNVDLDEFHEDGMFENVQNFIHRQGMNGYAKQIVDTENAAPTAAKKRIQLIVDGKAVFDNYVDFFE